MEIILDIWDDKWSGQFDIDNVCWFDDSFGDIKNNISTE